MTLPPLPDAAVVLDAEAGDWRAAVRQTASALQRAGAVSSGYAERMIDVIEQYGAYLVVAPGLALAHARPGPDVRHEGIAVVTLAEPVAFGHPHHDPVSVVVGLAVENAEEHVGLVAELANAFDDPELVARLADADSPGAVRDLLGLAAA